MIKKINIKNLALFKDFEWDVIVRDKPGNNVVEFKKENIFYGRNYSGKTTLSRIIRALETKEISEKYSNPEFDIVLADNTHINQTTFASNTLQVRCFNEDFIKENLSFIINQDSDIKPFAILGENSEIEQKIEVIKRELGSNTEGARSQRYLELENLQKQVNDKKKEFLDLKNTLDDQLTNKATRESNSIKQLHSKFGDINYTKTKLQNDINHVQSAGYTPINEQQEALYLQQIKEEKKESVNFDAAFENRYKQELSIIQNLLGKSLLDTNKIAELLTNSELNAWVKEGYQLHCEDKEAPCKFCGNHIESSRWTALDNHYDEESKKLEFELTKVQERLRELINTCDSYKLPATEQFYACFANDIIKWRELFDSHVSKYKTDLNFLLSKIEERLQSLHKPIEYNYTITFSEDELLEIINSYKEIELKNNEYSDKLEEDISLAKKQLRYLEVYRFIDTIKYSNILQNIDSKQRAFQQKENEVIDLKKSIGQKENILEDLTRLLNNEEEGAKRVNEYLNSYFGNNNLKLQAIEEEVDASKKIRFNIVRNGEIAYHLSEGECSIISFCYFMAKLDDIHSVNKKPIIFIDDPISSLDSNHIFYVYSLINAELFSKDRFEQIFISTHNLDFLKYLKRLKFTKGKNHEYFIINRCENYSEILLMPNYLKDYVTEFNFLFEQIYKCANAEIATDDNHHLYYNFGNNARKFLEALLFYKYPSRIDGQTPNANSKRLLKYFGDNQQATMLTDRVNNELSHLEEIFDRGMRPIDIPELKKVARFILSKMEEKDSEQYQALLESIGVTDRAI